MAGWVSPVVLLVPEALAPLVSPVVAVVPEALGPLVSPVAAVVVAAVGLTGLVSLFGITVCCGVPDFGRRV